MREIRGYLAALAAGNLAFWATGLASLLILRRGVDVGDQSGILGFAVIAAFTLVVSVATTILPFIAFLAVSRLLGIRRWVYFVICGMAMGLVSTALVIGRWREGQVWAANAALLQHLIISGGVGGLAYWWTAVRQSHGPPPLPVARD